jgi:hypothetical protein
MWNCLETVPTEVRCSGTLGDLRRWTASSSAWRWRKVCAPPTLNSCMWTSPWEFEDLYPDMAGTGVERATGSVCGEII